MSGSPRSARISRERCWTSGVRASSSNRRESIEMGNAAARTWRSRPSSPGTVMIGPRVVWARSRRTARMKFAASPARWKPTRSAPSRPSITWRRHGSCWNSSSGERDVVEEPDPHVRALGADHLRHELELVVVHPDDGARGCLRDGGVGEALVDAAVRVPPRAVVRGRGDDVVVERPERVVREALVVPLDLVGRERHGHEAHLVGVERLARQVGRAGPADPGTVGRLHDGLERRDQASGRPLPLDLTAGADREVHGQPVGHHDEIESLFACQWTSP